MGYALGIDLGTTYTAAAIYRDGRVEIVSLGSHANTIPTVAYARESGELLVGEAALARGLNDPGRYGKEFKRRLGSTTPIVLGGTAFTPEELLGRVLASVLETVTSYQGERPEHVVVTHPASWAGHRLERLRMAVETAGIDDVDFAAEPVAAAVFYSSQERVPDDAVIAVYDLGGGTFDASVLRKSGSEFDLVGRPEGDDTIGGIDFDRAVLEHVATSLGDDWTGLDLTDGAVASGVEQLRRSATSAKELLSDDLEATIPVTLPGISRDVRMTRRELEERIRPDIESTLETMQRAITNTALSADDIDTVLLVGGSSRVPLVGEVIGNGLGLPLAVDAHPKLAICQGAALIAADRAGIAAPGPEPETEPEPQPEPEPVSGTPPSSPSAGHDPVAEASDHARRAILTPRILAMAAGLVAVLAVGLILLLSDDDPVVAEPLVLPPGDPVTVELWTAHSGPTESAVNELVADFEAANPEIDVEITTMAGYGATLDSLLTATEDERPNVVVLAERAGQLVRDAGLTRPVHELISQDDFDPTTLVPVLAAQFGDEDGLFAIPFTPAPAVVYLNLDVLRDGGISLSRTADWTTDDLVSICDELGERVEPCFIYEFEAFLYEQLIANSGELVFDHGNGRDARAESVAFDTSVGRSLFDFFVDAAVSGDAAGRDEFATFADGRAAMVLSNAGRLHEIEEAIALGDAPFRLGVAQIPHAPGTARAGGPAGEGSLWIVDAPDDRLDIAAWLLVEFLASPESQAFLHRELGSAPASEASAPLLEQYWADNPPHRVAFDHLESTVIEIDGRPNRASAGGVAGAHPAIGGLMLDAFRAAIDESDGVSADEAFATLVAVSDACLKAYNDALDLESSSPPEIDCEALTDE